MLRMHRCKRRCFCCRASHLAPGLGDFFRHRKVLTNYRMGRGSHHRYPGDLFCHCRFPRFPENMCIQMVGWISIRLHCLMCLDARKILFTCGIIVAQFVVIEHKQRGSVGLNELLQRLCSDHGYLRYDLRASFFSSSSGAVQPVFQQALSIDYGCLPLRRFL